MRKINRIIVHCAATPPTADIGAKEIDRWHREQGWSRIGYHKVIRRNGVIEDGRPYEDIGAHVAGHNADSIGICLVGGVDVGGPKGKPKDNFTPEQFKALAELLAKLKVQFPGVTILGHRDIPGVAKACPSFDVRSWLKSVNL